jgi:hypothetical protein
MRGQQRLEVVERVDLVHGLVVAPAEHAGEAEGDAGLVAGGGLDALEADLEDLDGLDLPDGAELLDGCACSPRR